MNSVEAVVGEGRAEKSVSAVPRAEVVDGVAALCATWRERFGVHALTMSQRR
jgi:hypothetical protein